MRLLVTGGTFDGPGHGLVWLVDLAEERGEVWTRWAPPKHLRVRGKGFAGGCACHGHLYVSAHAALVRIDIGRATINGVLHQPDLNDLHHVACNGRDLWVANTGLDAIERFDLEGNHRARHAWQPGWVTGRQIAGSRPENLGRMMETGWHGQAPSWSESNPHALGSYYQAHADATLPFHQRKVRDRLHPNHVVVHGEDILVTCLRDGSIRRPGGPALTRLDGAPHDGVIRDGALWCTTVDGFVHRRDWPPEVEGGWSREHDIFETGHSGWCRGLYMDADTVVVGLTRVDEGRATTHSWRRGNADETETSVIAVDRRTGALLARVVLDVPSPHTKIYSLLPYPIESVDRGLEGEPT